MKYYLTNQRREGNVYTFDLYLLVEDVDNDQEIALANCVQTIKERTLANDTSVFCNPNHGDLFTLRPSEDYGEEYHYAIKTWIQFGFRTDGALASFNFFQNDHLTNNDPPIAFDGGPVPF